MHLYALYVLFVLDCGSIVMDYSSSIGDYILYDYGSVFMDYRSSIGDYILYDYGRILRVYSCLFFGIQPTCWSEYSTIV